MKKLVMFLLLIVLISNFVSAGFAKGNPSHSIEKNYSLGSFITGWFNVSFSDEPVNSVFETSEGDSISLIDLISLNEISGSLDYTCSSPSCDSDYVSVSGTEATAKEFFLNAGESKIVGLRFSGASGFIIPTETTSRKVSIDIYSDAGESTFEQLFIDVLNDGITEWQSYEPSGNFQNENQGCFNPSAQKTSFDITTNTLFCEKINLPIVPKVEIGANVIPIPTPPNSATFVLSIDNENGNNAECEAIASAQGRISCITPADFKVNEQEDYYVCIKAKEAIDSSKYKINSETSGDVCGYATSKNFQKDFDIFAKLGRFESIGDFTLDDDEISNYGSNAVLEEDINDYITENYGGDCTEECIVPIKFTSGKVQQQNIGLSNVNIQYLIGGIDYSYPSTSYGDFELYELSEIPAEITSDFIQLYLDDAGFATPEEFGSSEFSLSLEGTEIFSETIEIEKVPQIVSLNPNIIIATFPTEFNVNVNTFNSSARITSYKWDFGNNQILTTNENKVVYTYNQTGTYSITITINDSNGKGSSRTFDIEVATPRQAVSMLLKRNLDNLNNIKSFIANLSSFEQTSLNAILNLEDTESIISELQTMNATAVDDGDYIAIMPDLMALNLPQSIDVTKKIDSFPFYPSEENVNLNVLKEIGGGDFGEDKEEYIQAVLGWNALNVQVKMNFKEFTALFRDSEEELLNVFELETNENQGIRGAYLIMPVFENIMFKLDYGEQEVEDAGYMYIQLNGGETIVFSTTEDIEFLELPAFISPPLDMLPVQKTFQVFDIKKISNMTLIILVVLLVGFIGFIVYIVMQEWYKRKYENHLFTNRNDLYNIVSYIHNMKKQGVEDKKVAEGLKKSGWNSEQVSYIMKKYYRKRTGMLEIPLEKIFGMFKKKSGENFGNQSNMMNPRKFNKLE